MLQSGSVIGGAGSNAVFNKTYRVLCVLEQPRVDTGSNWPEAGPGYNNYGNMTKRCTRRSDEYVEHVICIHN